MAVLPEGVVSDKKSGAPARCPLLVVIHDGIGVNGVGLYSALSETRLSPIIANLRRGSGWPHRSISASKYQRTRAQAQAQAESGDTVAVYGGL